MQSAQVMVTPRGRFCDRRDYSSGEVSSSFCFSRFCSAQNVRIRRISGCDQKTSLDQQRAYQIVCLMVGSDNDKFKDLASETKLPEDRGDSCAEDYSDASYAWDALLKPHLRSPDQPKTKIDMVYGEARGGLEPGAQAAQSILFLETVAQNLADTFVWPTSFTLEMRSCGFPNARWVFSTHKLTVCTN
jgi:hypothetical protein